jgi:6-phosphofructokinase
VIGSDVEVDLPKPVVSTPATSDEIFWGIEVPFGTNSAPHTGVNSFTAISD